MNGQGEGDVVSVEKMVRELDDLRREANRYEGFMRSLRLGRGIEMIRFRFRAGTYGYGWINEKNPERMPAGMEREFYDFLEAKAKEIHARGVAAAAVLDGFTISKEES